MSQTESAAEKLDKYGAPYAHQSIQDREFPTPAPLPEHEHVCACGAMMNEPGPGHPTPAPLPEETQCTNFPRRGCSGCREEDEEHASEIQHPSPAPLPEEKACPTTDMRISQLERRAHDAERRLKFLDEQRQTSMAKRLMRESEAELATLRAEKRLMRESEAELATLRAENAKLKAEKKTILSTDTATLNRLTRRLKEQAALMREAGALDPDTLPDLGRLLEWLMGRRAPGGVEGTLLGKGCACRVDEAGAITHPCLIHDKWNDWLVHDHSQQAATIERLRALDHQALDAWNRRVSTP